MVRGEKIKVLWLKPKKGQVSIGRAMIADNLSVNYDVGVVEVSISRMPRIIMHLAWKKFDVVIGTTHLGIIIGGLAKLLGKRLVVDFVDDYETLLNRFPSKFRFSGKILILLERCAVKLADAVIVIPSKNYREISFFRNNVFKTNLCINLERFASVEDCAKRKAEDILKMAGVDLKKPKVVYIGGFNRIYNLDILIKAMQYLEGCQLLLIGGGVLEDELRGLKNSLGLKNVFFLGYFPNDLIPGFLKLSNVGVSLCEVPRQLKIYEYLAAGLSVVVPESVLSSEDFEFAEYCIGTKLDVRDVAKKIEIAMKVPRKRDKKLMKLLEKYSCRKVAEVYEHVIRALV